MVRNAAASTDPAILTRPFYSPAEVAELADVSPSTILNYIPARADRSLRRSAPVDLRVAESVLRSAVDDVPDGREFLLSEVDRT